MKKALVGALVMGFVALSAVGGTVLAQGGGGDAPQRMEEEVPVGEIVLDGDEDTCFEDRESVPATELLPAINVIRQGH